MPCPSGYPNRPSRIYYKKMPAPLTAADPPQPELRLMVELPSWRDVFLSNLRDSLFPRRLAPLELRSAPAAFWPDVFVKRNLPWDGFMQSGACHLIAVGLLIGLTRLLAMQPRVVQAPVFDHSEVVYYQPSEYLPPLDTRSASTDPPRRADPELAPQPIISVPAEADNRSQTIVTPPKIRLRRDIRLPNIVAWSDASRKPRLEIPDAPLTPASEITRIAPKLENPVVTPPPDSARIAHRRNSPALQNSVVAPPPEVHSANTGFQGLQADPIAPPPTVDAASNRRVGSINIAPTTVIAPAPQLPLAAQRTVPAGRLDATGASAAQVVPPPPAVAAGASSASFGSPGRVIALNLHPAIGGPPDPPAGNRRGSFAASPEGHSGASGAPGSTKAEEGVGTGAAGVSGGKTNGSGASHKEAGTLPSGLYVGNSAEKTSSVAGDPGPKSPTNSVNPNLLASAAPPRVTGAARPMQPGNESSLTEPERAVFGNRRFYSVTLNMPNLNSGGGSWVVRFAELNHEPGGHDATEPKPDLTQPMATRKVDPAYPLQLMRENVAGTVILYAVIHADGTVANVRVLRSVDDRLDRYASEAVAQWKFDPATKNGAPVDVEATFHIPFRPSRNAGTNF